MSLLDFRRDDSDKENYRQVIDFPSNRLLIDLCGQLDSNLAKIEGVTGIRISRMGNSLEVSGSYEECKIALAALQSIYSRLETGRSLEQGDIDAAIRMPGDLFDKSAVENSEKLERDGLSGDKYNFEIRTQKKVIGPRTKSQKSYIKKLIEKDIVFGVGPAGTGKTYLAIAIGVSMYLTGKVDKIVLTRPAVEAGERLGFLPGDMKEKVDPYMQPLYDALNDCLPSRQLAKMIDEKLIEIAPLAFMRGRTLNNAFVVLDEAQNATTMQMKMFLTRLGEGSRMVLTGDITQIDLPRGTISGLVEAIKILNNLKDIGIMRFSSDDVVRHKMVAEIIKAYERFNFPKDKG